MMNYTPGSEVNPFFAIMPRWFLLTGIIISTAASIIASQALISGSFTLISEAVSLNFWPKIKIINPTLCQRPGISSICKLVSMDNVQPCGNFFQRIIKYGGSLWSCNNHYNDNDNITVVILSLQERN